MILYDYMTEIKHILHTHKDRETRVTKLRKLLSDSEAILKKHIESREVSIDTVVEYLLQPATQRRIAHYELGNWIRGGHKVARKLKSLLGETPEPSIVLYPGLRRVNGKILHLRGNPVIALSPDFGYCSGHNMSILIAHEYVHYLRARTAGIKFEKMPLHRLIFEEGLAVYITAQTMPELPLPAIFMSALHNKVGMKDPPGGYIRWCKANLRKLASAALESLASSDEEDLAKFFTCGRFAGKSTPIRTGYYLGFKVIETAVEEYNPAELIRVKPSIRRVRGWLTALAEA